MWSEADFYGMLWRPPSVNCTLKFMNFAKQYSRLFLFRFLKKLLLIKFYSINSIFSWMSY